MIRLSWIIGLLMIGLAACQTTLDNPSVPTPTENFLAFSGSVTPIPTVVIPSDTATIPAQKTPTSPTIQTRQTAAPTGPPSPIMTVTASPTPPLEHSDHYWLQRPIAQEGDNVHWIDRSYPYGGTQFGEREVHLGVEFVNTRFTPVHAVADGIVQYAGDDTYVRYGPRFDYYGNLVVIEHPFLSPDDLPVYTLYAHLQDIAVETGTPVIAGQRIGRVGDSGIALGPHLHFEVRLGNPFDYMNTRNPDLWIQPYAGFGTLAGRVTGTEHIYGVLLLVSSETVQRETYTYGGDRVNSDDVWNENFTLGDLPVDEYAVVVTDSKERSYFREQIRIVPDQTTWLEIDLSSSDYEP